MRISTALLRVYLLFFLFEVVTGCAGPLNSIVSPGGHPNPQTSTPIVTWPSPASVPAGTALGEAQLNATANVPGVFSYSPAAGTVLPAGTQTLKATFQPADSSHYSPVSATAIITVTASQSSVPTISSVTVSGTSALLQIGQSLGLSATAAYSDNSTKDVTTQATWLSSSSSVASVSAGNVTGLATGGTQIVASYGGVASAPVPVTVSQATVTIQRIQVSGASTLGLGSSIQLKAVGTYSDQTAKDLTSAVTWTSSSPSVATVQAGIVTGLAAGSAQIAASYNGVASAPVSVAVSQSVSTLKAIQINGASTVGAGATIQLKAMGTYSDQTVKDLTGAVTWSSSSTSVAGVQTGLVTGGNAGTATVMASQNGVSASTIVTVTSGHVVQVDSSMTQAEIQDAINGSQSGDTISFAAGTYPFIVPGLRLPDSRSYLGSNSGTTILSGTGGYDLMVFYGNGLTLQNFTFDGGGLYLGGPVTGVNVEDNTFQNINAPYINWTTEIAIFIDSNATNSDFSHNTFKNIGANLHDVFEDEVFSSGIFGYGLSNVTIEYNTFDTFTEGVHIFYDSLDGMNVHINHNTFLRGHRIAIEQQDSKAGGLEVAYNSVDSPLNAWALTYGLSIAATSDSGTGILVHDNVINANTPVAVDCTGSGCYYPYGIEAWGTGTKVYNNLIEGLWQHGVAIGAAQNLSVTDNTICGPNLSANNTFVDFEYGSEPGTVIQNNTTSANMTCSLSN